MKILSKHRDWVAGAIITESDDEQKGNMRDCAYRRYTATIRG